MPPLGELKEPSAALASIDAAEAMPEVVLSSDVEIVAAQRPPFAFAKRHGVMVKEIGAEQSLLV